MYLSPCPDRELSQEEDQESPRVVWTDQDAHPWRWVSHRAFYYVTSEDSDMLHTILQSLDFRLRPETTAEPCLEAKQLQLKRARLADDLDDKIFHRLGPMELVQNNILPVHSSIKQATIGKPDITSIPYTLLLAIPRKLSQWLLAKGANDKLVYLQ